MNPLGRWAPAVDAVDRNPQGWPTGTPAPLERNHTAKCHSYKG